jgi:hypothetical protein
MFPMGRLLAAVFWVQIAALAAGQSASPRPTFDLRAPRAEIRKRLLQYTPLGSKLDDVKKFISDELAKSGDDTVKVEKLTPSADNGAARGPKAAKRIRVYLGQYYDQAGVIFLTAPLVSQKEVSVEWRFDDHDSLVDIIVAKKPTVY